MIKDVVLGRNNKHQNPTYHKSLLGQLNRKLTLHIPREIVFCMLSRRMLAPLLYKLVSKKPLAYT